MLLVLLQGMLPPLDAPHHLRKHEWAPFREGIDIVHGEFQCVVVEETWKLLLLNWAKIEKLL